MCKDKDIKTNRTFCIDLKAFEYLKEESIAMDKSMSSIVNKLILDAKEALTDIFNKSSIHLGVNNATIRCTSEGGSVDACENKEDK